MKPVRETFSFLFSRPYGLLCLILLDFLFLGVLLLMSPLFKGFDSYFFSVRPLFQYWSWISLYAVGMIVVLVLLSIAISLYKQTQFAYLRQMVHGSFRWLPTREDYHSLKKFIFLNVKLLVPLFLVVVVALVYMIQFMKVKSGATAEPVELAAYFFLLLMSLAVLLFVVFYLMSLVQVYFGRKKPVALALRSFFPSLKIIWHDLKMLFVGGLLIGLVHLFFKVFLFGNMRLYLSYYGVYKRSLWFLLVVVLYSVLMFNRMYLYRRFHNAHFDDKAKV